MKKEELIEKLQKLPDNIEVCVFDWRKNVNDDCGDGSGVGIYPNFIIELMGKSEIKKGYKPFLAITIENDDYNECGKLIKHK